MNIELTFIPTKCTEGLLYHITFVLVTTIASFTFIIFRCKSGTMLTQKSSRRLVKGKLVLHSSLTLILTFVSLSFYLRLLMHEIQFSKTFSLHCYSWLFLKMREKNQQILCFYLPISSNVPLSTVRSLCLCMSFCRLVRYLFWMAYILKWHTKRF